MDEALEFLAGRGWRVLSCVGNLITIHVQPIDMVRAACRLRRAFQDIGVLLHAAGEPFDRPCAWVEYDVATMHARIHLVISDEWMPRGRAAKEAADRATATALRPDPLTP